MDPTTNITAYEVYQMLPVIFIIEIFVYLYYRLTGKTFIDSENYDSYEPEEILKRRFAKGEIGIMEYTERMARL